MRQQKRETFVFLCLVIGMAFMLICTKVRHFQNITLVTSPENFLEEEVQKLADHPEIFRPVANFAEKSQWKSSKEDDSAKAIAKQTVVLMWTKYYDVDDTQLMSLILSGRKYDFSCCRGDDLLVTLDRKLLPNATVVVFFSENLDANDLPFTRSPAQKWVLFLPESPIFSQDPGAFPNLFNWTMSYRRGSDIWSPYGFKSLLEHPLSPKQPLIMPNAIPFSNLTLNKSKLLLPFIPRCSLNPKIPALSPKSDLPFDISTMCDTNVNQDQLWRIFGTHFKFYWAAEDAFCVDYITTNFWRALQVGMVPVVYGGANYATVAPPNSFIDATKFKSVEKLTQYLVEVGNDPKLYAKYFEWRRRYRVTPTKGWGGWCDLCQMARVFSNSPEERKMSKNTSYADLWGWWNTQKVRSKTKVACYGPPRYPRRFPIKRRLVKIQNH